LKDFIKNWGLIFLIVLVFLIVRLFIITPVSVKGHSMDPTLADGQKLMTYQLSEINRFDIITTQEPDDMEKLAVKRVIGLPGDRVQMQGDVLSINDKQVEETYLQLFKEKFSEDQLQKEYAYNPTFQNIAQGSENFTNDFTYEVPEGKYFVLGDNRLISKDSRMFGFVDEEMIKGEVVFRYWPISEIGTIK